MASPRIEYAVLPAGEGPGQDRCFTADGLVVVLDGASAVDPVANPDATEYVDTLGPLLVEQITGTPGIDLRVAFAEAIRQTVEKLTLVPGTAPSSTVSIVRWGDETVDILVLGDSPVVLQFIDGRQEIIVQHPQEHIATEFRQLYRERLIAGHGYDDRHRAILAEIQRAEARARNRPHGYWIAEAEEEAAWHAELKRCSPQHVVFAIVATDGAYPIGFQSPRSWREIAQLSGRELAALLRELSQWESESDPNGQCRPRSKMRDDKAVVGIRSSSVDQYC